MFVVYVPDQLMKEVGRLREPILCCPGLNERIIE